MKEALAKIRAAELKNEELQNILNKELANYQFRKDEEIQLMVTNFMAERKHQVEQKEASEQQVLDQQKAVWIKEAESQKAEYQRAYERNHEQVVAAILKKVKENYGR